jgi:hypothetical protein
LLLRPLAQREGQARLPAARAPCQAAHRDRPVAVEPILQGGEIVAAAHEPDRPGIRVEQVEVLFGLPPPLVVLQERELRLAARDRDAVVRAVDLDGDVVVPVLGDPHQYRSARVELDGQGMTLRNSPSPMKSRLGLVSKV